MEYRIALAQVAPRLGEVDANFELLAERLTAAAGEGAALVVFPELALTGYLLQDLVPEVSMRVDDPRLDELSRGAPGTLVAVGFVEETDDHRYCNSVALLRDGEVLADPPQALPADVRALRRGAIHERGRSDPDGRRGRTPGAHRPVGVRGLLASIGPDAAGPRRGQPPRQRGRRTLARAG